MKDAVIFDLDGTLADVTHRLHHLQNRFNDDKPRWNEFNEACGQDEPIWPIIRLVHMHFQSGQEILICTGRMANVMHKTIEWLKFHSIPFKELHMRKIDDFRSDVEVKKEMLDNITKKYAVRYVYEDRKGVTQMFRDCGLVCLQVKEGDY